MHFFYLSVLWSAVLWSAVLWPAVLWPAVLWSAVLWSVLWSVEIFPPRRNHRLSERRSGVNIQCVVSAAVYSPADRVLSGETVAPHLCRVGTCCRRNGDNEPRSGELFICI